MRRFARGIIGTAIACFVAIACPAVALDFRAVADNAAVLYDAPSTRANRLYLVNRGYPLEIIVNVEGWVKVRDAVGALTWVEGKQLTDKRTVMVKVPVAQIRQKPDDNAAVAFQAQQNVILDLIDVASGGWMRVRHRDGGTGYVKSQQVWGV
jgi:SH3-like domain-containing protein